MVRELKKFKTHFQQKEKIFSNLFQVGVSDLNASAERSLETDPLLAGVVKTTKKIAMQSAKRKRIFEMYKRRLRDLEELRVDIKKYGNYERRKLFEQYENEELKLADAELETQFNDCIIHLTQQVKLLKDLSGV